MTTLEICEGVAGVDIYEPLAVDSAEYHRVHKFVREAFGLASEWDCVQCGRTAFHWAWQHGEDPRSIASYEPMCVPCHFVYDDNTKNGFKEGNTVNLGRRKKL
jgi:hypothetical protein